MKAKALVRFCVGNITAEPGNIIEFDDKANDIIQMLLYKGWIELVKVPTA